MAAYHIVLKAVFLIALLAGHDCARIQAKASFETAQQRLGARFSSKSAGSAGHEESSAWWIQGGNEVCREKDLGNTKSIDRYHYKMQKLKELSTNLRENTCGKSCPQKWLELKERTRLFDSCAELLQDAAAPNVLPDLKEAMLKGDDALLQGMREPMGAVSALIKKKGLFPTFPELPACNFNPMALDVDSAVKSSVPEDAVRKQLFGEDCDDASSKQYVSRLEGQPRRIATSTLDQLSQVLGLKQRVDNVAKAAKSDDAEQMKQADAELTKEVQAIATQLTKQSEEGHDQEANSTMSMLLQVDPGQPQSSSKLSRFFGNLDNTFFEVIAWFLGILLAIFVTVFLIAFIQAGGVGAIASGVGTLVINVGSNLGSVVEVPVSAAVRLGVSAGTATARVLTR